MTRYFCFSVTFLDPLFHGKADGDEPEWPPSPLRLFQALLAGTLTGCRKRNWCDEKAEAFRWLERRDPPEIVAANVQRASAYTLYVPNNDSDKEPDRQNRLTSKSVRPHCLLDGQELHYLWSITDNEWQSARPRIELLCQESRYLLALGWGVDVVVGNGRVLDKQEAASLTGIRWKPWHVHRDSSERRRVPKQGTLDDLGSVYESFVNSVEGKKGYCPRRKPTVFDTVSYLPATSLPPRPYVAFTLDSVMEQARRSSFRQVDTVLVAAMLRHQACEAAKHDSHEFPTGSELYVAGHVRERHDTPQRFSYLPLPSIGHEHADGMIRRVLIAEPYGSDGEHARWAADRLRNANLVDEDRQPKAVLVRPEPGDYVLQSYVRQSKRWSSVTPVILPGLDDGKLHKRDAVFLKAVKQARLPADLIESFTLRSAPFWPGSQHPHEYRRPAYLKRYPAWHVHLQLREAIAGPLAIGAGRHCGLGLFAPERVQDSHDK